MASESSRKWNRWLPAIAGLVFLVVASTTAVTLAGPPKVVPPPPSRATMAQQVFDRVRAGFTAGQGTIDEVYTWSVHWLDAELAGASKAARKRAFADHRARMIALRADATKMTEQGLLRATAPLKADYFVAEAEAWAKKLSR